MTKTMMRAAIGCAMLAGVPGAAAADDGDDYKFVLFNSSAASAISFQTQKKDGKWSANWLTTPMKPAVRRNMTFAEGDDRCEIPTRIQFSDGSKFETPVDYCGVSEVIATDETLYSK